MTPKNISANESANVILSITALNILTFNLVLSFRYLTFKIIVSIIAAHVHDVVIAHHLLFSKYFFTYSIIKTRLRVLIIKNRFQMINCKRLDLRPSWRVKVLRVAAAWRWFLNKDIIY